MAEWDAEYRLIYESMVGVLYQTLKDYDLHDFFHRYASYFFLRYYIETVTEYVCFFKIMFDSLIQKNDIIYE